MTPKSRANPTDAQTKVSTLTSEVSTCASMCSGCRFINTGKCEMPLLKKKKKKTGTHGSPVISWQALRARGSVSALQRKTQMFNSVWRGSDVTLSACIAAFATYWGASCSDADGPLWSLWPSLASGALKSGRPWREVHLTSSITFCLCSMLPSLLQGQQVRSILWLRRGPAHSTHIRTKGFTFMLKNTSFEGLFWTYDKSREAPGSLFTLQ